MDFQPVFAAFLKKFRVLDIINSRVQGICLHNGTRIIHRADKPVLIKHPGYSIRAEPSYFAYRIMIKRRINNPLLHLHFFCQLQHLFFYLGIKNNAGF